MNSLPILLRREFQEHRGMFLYLPLALSAFLIAMVLLALVAEKTGDGRGYTMEIDRNEQGGQYEEHRSVAITPFSNESMHRLAEMDPEQREVLLNKVYAVISAPLLLTLWIAVLVYLLGTLYGERKDRSILFWKSMPVSDAATVLSKLLSAAIVLPAIYFACIVLVQAALLLISSAAALAESIDVWNTLWMPAHVVDRWLRVLGYLGLNAIWYLPASAWLLLVSSWARSVPAAWAVAVPIGLMIVERLLTPFHWLSQWIRAYAFPLHFRQDRLLDPESFQRILNPEMAASLLIAAVMIYGAIYMRGRTDEI